ATEAKGQTKQGPAPAGQNLQSTSPMRSGYGLESQLSTEMARYGSYKGNTIPFPHLHTDRIPMLHYNNSGEITEVYRLTPLEKDLTGAQRYAGDFDKAAFLESLDETEDLDKYTLQKLGRTIPQLQAMSDNDFQKLAADTFNAMLDDPNFYTQFQNIWFERRLN